MNLDDILRYKFLLTDDGRGELLEEIKRQRQKHGARWFENFKTEFPDLVFVVDLIANHNAPDALLKFKEFITGQIDSVDVESIKDFLKESFPGFGFLGSALTEETLRIQAKNRACEWLDDGAPALYRLHSELRVEIDKPRF